MATLQSGFSRADQFRRSTQDSSVLETVKVILLGKANIGKTALTRRFIHGDFTALEATVRLTCMLALSPFLMLIVYLSLVSMLNSCMISWTRISAGFTASGLVYCRQ